LTKSALLIEMIDLIRNKPGITVCELAGAMERSERTIYRWMNELSCDLNVPVVYLDGGYKLISCPPGRCADLTPEELLALRLSLKSAPFADGSPIKAHAECAWSKIKKAASGENLQQLVDMADSYSVNEKSTGSDADPAVADVLQHALNQHRRVRVLYRSQNSAAVRKYEIDPYAIVFRRHSWYLLAYCPTRGSVLQFKLLRFVEAVETGDTFQTPDDFSVEEYFRLSWEAWGGGEPTHVKIRFSPKVAGIISETRRHPTQVVHPQQDGGVVMEVMVSGINEIAGWLMGYGKEAEVLEPESLRDYVCDHAKGMVCCYTKKS